MFTKILTRISIALVAVTVLAVGFSVVIDTPSTSVVETEISTAMVEEVPAVEAELSTTYSVEEINSLFTDSEMVSILVEEANNATDDPFEGLSDNELKCVFSTMLEEFTLSELVAVSNNLLGNSDRLVRLEQTWINVCGLERFVDSINNSFSA